MIGKKQIGTICFSKISRFFACFFVGIFLSFVGTGVANAVTYLFSITTTSISSGGIFTFTLSAKGTFYVDCGTGGTLSGTGVSGGTITRTANTNADIYTCTYSSAGVKTVQFGGVPTSYDMPFINRAALSFYSGSNDTNKAANADKVASVSGDLSALFPCVGGTGAGKCPRFSFTFQHCTNLTSIPANLFSRSNGEVDYMFYGTFKDCSRLASIPENLFFPNVTSVSGQISLFSGTFQNCTSLTSIPANLFSKITTAKTQMFANTFYGCTSLTRWIPKNLFAGLIANGSPTETRMWSYTFGSTGLVTSCPVGTVQYITGYESEWNDHVSCLGNTIGLSWNGNANTTPTSCDIGDTFIPPTPAARTGYVFTGWKVKAVNP